MEWTECYSKSRQRPYWFNKKTGVSIWESPHNIVTKKQERRDPIKTEVFPSKRRRVKDFPVKVPTNGYPLLDEPPPENIDFEVTILNDTTSLNVQEALNFLQPLMEEVQNSTGHPTGHSVVRHYDQLAQKTLSDRNLSSSIYLRNLNNWIKVVLLSETVKNVRALSEYNPETPEITTYLKIGDFACGRGGDLTKWSHYPIQDYYGVDISPESIQRAQERYVSKRFTFQATFQIHDLSLPLQLQCPPCSLDLISMQFAIHYLFKSEQAIRCLLESVSHYLKRGGYFIFTTIDVRHVHFMLNESEEYLRKMYIKRTYTEDCVSFETPIMKLSMSRQVADQWKRNSLSPFGVLYTFTLTDAVTNCEEYVAEESVITGLAKQYNLKRREYQNFHQYYYTHADTYMNLFQKMVGSDHKSYGWHTAGFYSVYVYQKESF